MTAAPIQEILFDRLVAQGRADDPFALYVLAACEGPDVLTAFVAGGAPPVRPTGPSSAAERAAVPPTYLASIQVRAFRGIGEESALPLTPGPGVTLVVGRNGSGKSSFAEGAEVAFTGTSARWADKGSIEWLKGWRNVHAATAPRLVIELVQQDVGPTRLERTWKDPLDVKSGQAQIVDRQKRKLPLTATRWSGDLELYRPFLSYSELGGMLAAGPTRIYQALLAGLGLDDYVRVRDLLAAAEGEQGRLWDVSRKSATVLADHARAMAGVHPEEPRFEKVAALLDKTKRDLEAIGALVTSASDDARGSQLEALTRLTPPIDEALAQSLPVALRDQAARLRDMKVRTEGLMHGLSKLLREALAVARDAPQATCPVCGSDRPLDEAWQRATTTRLGEMDDVARAARELEERAREMVRDMRARCSQPPATLRTAAEEGAQSAVDAVAAWESWATGATLGDLDALAAHVERHAPPLFARLSEIAIWARNETARRDVVWQPFALEAARWVAEARVATAARESERLLKEAKQWVAATIDVEREARFAPVKAQAIRFWNTIAQASNVRLQDIELTGHGNAKRVALKVTVDDKEAPALGVLSQGELNAMTLSLFLPRVLLDATPFGFVLVDDPVQAMDEVRVDGLAQVLAEVGAYRQVVVFTHDARLPEAFERLALPHAKRKVTRGIGSAVAISPLIGPWEQRLKDATDVTLTPGLPDGIAGRVVPGFCRQALEAACTDALRRHWLQRGDAHVEVEQRLARRGLRELLALLFHGEAHKHEGLIPRLRKLKTRNAVEVIQDCQNGAHEGFTGDLKEMVDRTRALCEELRHVKPA